MSSQQVRSWCRDGMLRHERGPREHGPWARYRVCRSDVERLRVQRIRERAERAEQEVAGAVPPAADGARGD